MQPGAPSERLPRLVVIEGPLRGHVFELDDGPWTLGRGNGNRITVDDPSLSRQHCAFEWRAAELWLKDLDSHNGTSVNGSPAREHVLRAGDEIKAGRSVFHYLGREESPDLPSVRFEGSSIESPTLLLLPSEDSVYLKPGDATARAAHVSSAVKGYRALLRIAETVHASLDVQSLADALIEALLECIPAQRAAVLLFRPDEADAFLTRTRNRASAISASFDINAIAVHRALRECVSVLSSGEFLAAPLLSRQKALGVIYLDADRGTNVLNSDHLQLAAAAGVMCGAPIENALEFLRVEEENRELRRQIQIRHEMVGESAPMQQVYRLIARAAPSDSTVLVLGETGTGKELVAHAIHRNSAREKGPFVAINCATLTEALLESELFGHERGAFTGAVSQKRGKLEMADRGTIFLDEIGELPAIIQAKLLRVLQQREFERVGGTRTIRADLRIVAATNRDLRAEAVKGSFRNDLYYRLNVVNIRLPALRERRDDIPLLAAYFLDRCRGEARRVSGISQAAMSNLMAYDWPGNVRELQHAIESAVVMGEGGLILPEDLPEAIIEASPSDGSDSPGTYHGTLRHQKSDLIVSTIEQTGGSITEAARLLRLHPNYLHRLIRNLGLRERIKTIRQPGASGSP